MSFPRYSEILVENRDFFSPTLAFDAPVSAVLVGILPNSFAFGTEKLEWCAYQTVKNDDMFSRFDRIPACDRRTDELANGQTDNSTS